MKIIVISYTGGEPTKSALNNIIACLTACTDINKANVSVYNENDLVQMCAEKEVIKDAIGKKDMQQEAIENAITYIGEMFKEDLDNKNMLMFSARLSARVAFANTHGNDKNLLTAVNILSTHTGKIPAELAKKYKITKTVLDVIQKVNSNEFWGNVSW